MLLLLLMLIRFSWIIFAAARYDAAFDFMPLFAMPRQFRCRHAVFRAFAARRCFTC